MLHYNIFLQLIPLNLFHYLTLFFLLFHLTDPFLNEFVWFLFNWHFLLFDLWRASQLFFKFILFKFLLIVEQLLLKARIWEYYRSLFSCVG